MTNPQGSLILIGGNEDRLTEKAVLKAVLEEAGGSSAILVFITTASAEPEVTGPLYKQAFYDLGAREVVHLDLRTRAAANDPVALAEVDRCTGIMFSGGDQLRITSILGGTDLVGRIRERYENEPGFMVAGTSAGASALSRTMIYDGDGEAGLLKHSVQLTSGLGLIDRVIVDTHFIKRGRVARQLQVVATNPRLISLGLGEDTAVRVTAGHVLEVIGSGVVMIIDGTSITRSNISDIEPGQPISVHDVLLHALTSGQRFDLVSRSFLMIDEHAGEVVSEPVDGQVHDDDRA